VSTPNPNIVKLQYIGACSLLARLSQKDQVTAEDRGLIRRALKDCCEVFPTLQIYEWGDGASALEPKELP